MAEPAFDPDKYLKEKTAPAPAFDPDAYLKEKTGASPNAPAQRDFLSSMPQDISSGKFRDSGRTPGFGEMFDSISGVPVRTGLNEYFVKNSGLWPSLKAAASSFGTDPKSAPSGVDIAYDSGIRNPYAGSALATLIDVGGQLPVVPAAAKALKGAGGLLKDVAETRAFKALGPTKRMEEMNQAKGLVNSIGRTALDEGVVSPLASKKTMLQRANDLEDQKIGDLNDIIESVQQNKDLSPEQIADLEKSKFVPANAAEKLKSDIKAQNSEIPQEILEPRLKQVDQWLPSKDPKTIQQTQDFKTQMQKFIKDPSYWKDNPSASQDVLLGVRRAAREGIENNADAYAGLLGQEGGKVKNINRQVGNAMEMGNILEDRLAREGANRTFSLTDYLAGMSGHGALGWKGLLLAPVNKFAREKGSQLTATGANAISKSLLESPVLRQLAEKDPESFSDAVGRVARQVYLEGKSPQLAAENEEKKRSLISGR